MRTPLALLALLGILLPLLPAVLNDPYAASEADMNALLELKKTIWDDPNNALASWKETRNCPSCYGHPCNFTGIECDGKHWRVRSVYLQNQGLKGILSEIVGNLTIMLRLNISNNYFMGPLPRGFKDMVQLRVMDLSNNLFSGKIPRDMGHMRDLEEFYLANNMLSGPLLTFVNQTTCRGNTGRRCFTPNRRLVSVDLSQNSLTGKISSSYGTDLPKLVNLKLSYNRLVGRIPPELGMSGTLESFDVTQNMLTGPIPPLLVSIKLRWFAVVNNTLSGPVPVTATTLEYAPWGFLPGNPGLCGDIIGVDCPTKIQVWRKYVKQAASIALPTIVGIMFLRWLFPPDPYSVSRVRDMTQNFSHTKVIARGGTCVIYQGDLRTGETVAVKRFREDYVKEESKSRLFKMERKLLPYVRHPNIVRVFGGCMSKNLKCLVMELMPNGNLDMHIGMLPWVTRLDIAAGAAQGLAYLHGECQGPPAFHCDLKPSSILLDDKFHPCLTDIRLENNEVMAYTDATFAGATGYMPPELSLLANYTPSAEVYSFGTLMLHLLTGREPWLPVHDDGLQGFVREAYPDNLHSVLDPWFTDGPSKDQLIAYVDIALQCTTTLPEERPVMTQVLEMFKNLYILEPQKSLIVPQPHGHWMASLSKLTGFMLLKSLLKGKSLFRPGGSPKMPETMPPLTVNPLATTPLTIMFASTSDPTPQTIPPASTSDNTGATSNIRALTASRELFKSIDKAALAAVASRIGYCFK